MWIYIGLLIAAFVGLVTIAVIWYNELQAGKKISKKLALEQENNKKLSAENERISLQLKELSRVNEQLKSTLSQSKDDLLKDKSLIRRRIAEFLDETKLKDIMSINVVTIRYNSPFSEVARKMKEFNIRHLPVVDRDNKLVGLITQRMLYKIKSPRRLMDGEWYYDEAMLNDVILEHVMIKDVISLLPEEPMGTALLKMTHGQYGCIPVVDGEKRLVGVVTRKDVLKVAANFYEKELGKGKGTVSI